VLGGEEELKWLGQWEADLNLEPWEMLLIDVVQVALWCSCVVLTSSDVHMGCHHGGLQNRICARSTAAVEADAED
jgi:hypothetical protein